MNLRLFNKKRPMSLYLPDQTTQCPPKSSWESSPHTVSMTSTPPAPLQRISTRVYKATSKPIPPPRKESARIRPTSGIQPSSARITPTSVLEQQVVAHQQKVHDYFQHYPPPTHSEPNPNILYELEMALIHKGHSAWAFEPCRQYQTSQDGFTVYLNDPLLAMTDYPNDTLLEFSTCSSLFTPQPPSREEHVIKCMHSCTTLVTHFPFYYDPFYPQRSFYYYEVTLLEMPCTTSVCIGLVTQPYPSFQWVGWSPYSIGYYSVDGSLFINHIQTYDPLELFMEKDVVGIGYDPRYGTVYITLNGRLISTLSHLPPRPYHVALSSSGACHVAFNLGQKPFMYSLANRPPHHRRGSGSSSRTLCETAPFLESQYGLGRDFSFTSTLISPIRKSSSLGSCTLSVASMKPLPKLPSSSRSSFTCAKTPSPNSTSKTSSIDSTSEYRSSLPIAPPRISPDTHSHPFSSTRTLSPDRNYIDHPNTNHHQQPNTTHHHHPTPSFPLKNNSHSHPSHHCIGYSKSSRLGYHVQSGLEQDSFDAYNPSNGVPSDTSFCDSELYSFYSQVE